jgi:acyl-CoA thioesterase-1
MKAVLCCLLFFVLLSCSQDEPTPDSITRRSTNTNITPPSAGNGDLQLDIKLPSVHAFDKEADTVRFLALGDSYTIGTGERAENRWPNLLAARKRRRGFVFPEPKIIASVGWTTGNLLSSIGTDHQAKQYDLVSLLIGVNNQFRGMDFEVFQSEFLQLLTICVEKAKSRSSIIVLSIPDYGATPFGKADQERISAEIDQYNAFISKVCAINKINFYDITPISRLAKGDLSYLASDNLHPSKKMYDEWVELIIADPPAFLRQ